MLEFLNQAWPVVIFVLIVGIVFTLLMFLLMSILYMPAFLQKKVNLKRSEDILQHNIEIVEKATFFETSDEFNKLIQEQMDTIRKQAAHIKSQKAEMEALNKEKMKNNDK